MGSSPSKAGKGCIIYSEINLGFACFVLNFLCSEHVQTSANMFQHVQNVHFYNFTLFESTLKADSEYIFSTKKG